MMTANKTIRSPLFLVGAERSGTTLLRLMLSHHPCLAWVEEFEYAVDWVSDDGCYPDLKGYLQWLSTHRIFRATGFTIGRSLNYRQLVNSFLTQQLQRTGKRVIGATCHRHLARLLYIWPDACFVHLVRDGRDVARSCVAMGWAGNVWTGVEQWVDVERLWDRLKGKLSTERYIELTYESLIQEPEARLREICAFVGIPYAPAMLTYHLHSTYARPDPKLISQWRHKLSDRAIRLAESRIGSMLEVRGYELSGLEPLRVGRVMRWQLRLQNRWTRMRFRQRRYGGPLWLADVLSRRLRLEAWRRRVQLKLNQVDTAHLK